MSKLILLLVLVIVSCNNDPLLDGLFSTDVDYKDSYNSYRQTYNVSKYIRNLKFLNKNKAILILPYNVSCNKYSFDEIELDVERIDKNAIKLNFTNKDLKRSGLKDLLSFCTEDFPIYRKIKWEEYQEKVEEDGEGDWYSIRTFSKEDLSESNLLNNNFKPNAIYFNRIYSLLYSTQYEFYLFNGGGEFLKQMNTNSNALNKMYNLAIKRKLLRKYLEDKSEFKKYSDLSFKEFKTLLDIGYVNVVNEEYINANSISKEIDFINDKFIGKILIVKNLERETTIGYGDVVYFKRINN